MFMFNSAPLAILFGSHIARVWLNGEKKMPEKAEKKYAQSSD